ncbi:MAG: hypothetical protein ACRDNW_14440 [Trebonia sp.]
MPGGWGEAVRLATGHVPLLLRSCRTAGPATGAAGPGVPYDRIIITAGAWDVSPAWTGQAAPGARMVIPLRISGFTHEVTLQRAQQADGPAWISVHSHLSGFIKMRGAGQHREHDVPVLAGGQSELRVEAGVPVDPAALARATALAPLHRWTGVRATDPALPALEFWLARLGGLTRLINRCPGPRERVKTFV